MLLRAAAGLLSAAALGVTAGAAASTPISGPFGRGAAQVWLLRPAGPIRDVVVFGHGWKTAPPSPSYPWVGQFKPWLEHLAARGNAVIFPRYQLDGSDTANVDRVRSYEDGIRTGYNRLGRPAVPLVVVGYSFGGSLAFYFAGDARRLKLPVPRAVMAIFTPGMIAGATLRPLPASVRVLIQVGDQDGTTGGPAFWTWLSRHPKDRKRFEIIHSSAGFAATHAAPKGTGPTARRVFWGELDRLIAQAVA